MIYYFYFLIVLILVSCEKEQENNIMSNEANLNLDYVVNLNWDEDKNKSKTHVNIIWNKWTEESSFQKYQIKDVSTSDPKELADITSFEDTTYQVDFPTGTFIRLCVIATGQNKSISSDSIYFFTQPLSPVTNLSIDSQFDQKILYWEPSEDEQINNLIIYRAKIQSSHITLGSDFGAPTLDLSSNGEIENSTIYHNGEAIGEWAILYEGTNTETTYTDNEDLADYYSRYYTINVQIESTTEEENSQIDIANYRYSLIVPEGVPISEGGTMNTNLINQDLMLLTVTTDLDNIIKLSWPHYEGDDFYSYEIWRTDIETSDIQSVENTGQKLVEITTRLQDFFEDISFIGSEKSFYYFIRVNNNYGDSIESEVMKGDTTL
mgnify:CR=1 FL=1